MSESPQVVPTSPPVSPPTARRLFFGDDGLRAGWSFALFLLLAFALSAAANFAIARLHLLPKPARGAAPQLTPHNTIVGDGVTFVVAAGAAWLMSLIERRPFRRYGLATRRALPDFAAGFFWGIVLLSALVGALTLSHAIAFDGLALHGSEAVRYGLQWLLAFLLVGLAEEFFTRGYLQYTVGRGVAGIVRALDQSNGYSHPIGFSVAALLFSVLLFMAGHLGNPGENGVGIVAVGLAGAVFAFSLWRTGSLWWAIGIHTSWDWAQSFLYGTPDSGTVAQGHLLNTHATGSTLLSGGADGPEGSLLVIPTLLLIAVVIHFTLPRRYYPLTPDQTPAPINLKLT